MQLAANDMSVSSITVRTNVCSIVHGLSDSKHSMNQYPFIFCMDTPWQERIRTGDLE